MGEILNIQPKFKYVEKEKETSDSDSGSENSVDEFLPSVDFGPIDNSLALKTFPKWKPTKLNDALKETCHFFEKSFTSFPALRPIHKFSADMKKDIELSYLSEK